MSISIYRENCRLVFNIFGIKVKFKFKKFGYSNIVGKNNKIYIKYGNTLTELNSLKRIKGLNISINGNNNSVIIGYPNENITNCNLTINGDNNKFELGKSEYRIAYGNFSMASYGNNRVMQIGENFSLDNNSLLWCEENSSRLVIGNDCMFSHDLFLRNSDGHVILNGAEILNKAKDMIIGDHVWICAYAKLLKNVKISNNSIVGCGAVVTSNCDISNSVIAGNPAKIVKNNINWIRDNMNNYLNIQNNIHNHKSKTLAVVERERVILLAA